MILAQRRTPVWSTGILAWIGARPWLAVFVVLASWSLIPEVRRLIDWRVGYNSITVVSIVPLLALVPAALPLFYGGAIARLDRRLIMLAWIWFGGFTFSLVVGLLIANPLGAMYTYVQFCLPALFGWWVASLDVPARVLYERVASFLLWLTTPISLYGVLQFVAPPAWDRLWMMNAKVVSIGIPLPYQLRPFSTLNVPATFADLLVFTILLNLPRLRARNPLVVAQIAFFVGILTLTMVRSDWIAFAVGILTYIVLSPDRARNLALLAGIAALCGLLTVNASALLGSSQAGNGLDARFQTFTNLGSDISYNERARYWGDPLTAALQQPFGQGLGVVGTATKLGDSGSTKDFDNGYVARFTEMGYFGTACYLLVVAGALVLTYRRWRAYNRAGDRQLAGMAASVLAIQTSLIWLDVSSDNHNALPGLFFWLTLAFVLGRRPADPARAETIGG